MAIWMAPDGAFTNFRGGCWCHAGERIPTAVRRHEPTEVGIAVCQARTAPLVEDFGVWLRRQRARVSPKSRLGEKLAYTGNHWGELCVFLADRRVEIGNNVVENAIRPLALNRKNAPFADHDDGVTAWARIASWVETAKINGVNTYCT